jgi:hypothetical protein
MKLEVSDQTITDLETATNAHKLALEQLRRVEDQRRWAQTTLEDAKARLEKAQAAIAGVVLASVPRPEESQAGGSGDG